MPDDLWKMYSWWSLLQFTGAGDYPIYIYIYYIYYIYKYIYHYISYISYIFISTEKNIAGSRRIKKAQVPDIGFRRSLGPVKNQPNGKFAKKKINRTNTWRCFFPRRVSLGEKNWLESVSCRNLFVGWSHGMRFLEQKKRWLLQLLPSKRI